MPNQLKQYQTNNYEILTKITRTTIICNAIGGHRLCVGYVPADILCGIGCVRCNGLHIMFLYCRTLAIGEMIWILLLTMALIIYYITIALSLVVGDIKTKRGFFIALIPFSWLYIMIKVLIEHYNELK